MAQEKKMWSSASHRSGDSRKGGIHVYIDSETLDRALFSANIPVGSDLEVCRYPLRDVNRRYGEILLKIRVKKSL